jgi:hypothetical protein
MGLQRQISASRTGFFSIRRKIALGILLIILLPLGTIHPAEAAERDHSRLSSGKWVRIAIPKTGVYKIKHSELAGMGFSDPASVSVHGYGGWPLDEDFANPCIDDIPPTAVYRGSDYILFFGRGTTKWEYQPYSGTFVHTNNPYSTTAYYFLTDANPAEEMKRAASSATAPIQTISTYDEYRLHEEELVSVNESGRELFGESFIAGGSKTLTDAGFNIPGITNDSALVTMRFIARPKNTYGAAALSMDGNTLVTLSFRPAGSGEDDHYVKAIAAEGSAWWVGSKNERPQVTVSYNKAGDENVHLDYIRLHVKRNLSRYDDCTFFRSIASINTPTRFVIGNADESSLVFDVSDPLNPMIMETTLASGELSFNIPAGDLREFAVVQINRPLTGWSNASEIKNQDLHGVDSVDMVIIVADPLRSEAERLAERHRKDSMRVICVSPQQIYNEFSSGTPDATAYRRFIKMLYDKDEGARVKYLLLFGDGAYDNRNLTAEWKAVNRENMLLTYQSVNSLNQYSYVTDDYFGFMSNTSFNMGAIQIGIGRFPVRTQSEAAMIVDKVIAYMDNKETGDWKNRIAFVADDGNSADKYSTMHADSANRLADNIRNAHPEYMVSKLFFDAYKKTASTYPDIREGIKKSLRDGLLIINYYGHGDTEKWSDESVLTSQDIAAFTHTRLPLWITATCDFTRFDHPKTTAGENVFLQKSGGIAMLTTTRVVYAQENSALNSRLFTELMQKDEQGRTPALGDAVRKTKSALYNTNKYNFILIGDPAMRLSTPTNSIQITRINDQPVDHPVSFKALQKIKVEGQVLAPDDTPLPSFSGSLFITVFDSKQIRSTLDNNRTGNTLSFEDYPSRLFAGNDVVSNGQFSFTFTVPKDMSYSGDYGLMNLYAISESGEANGSYSGFTVDGSESGITNDSAPEILQLYLNDSTFVDGGIVNPTPLFVARVRDTNGLNISSGGVGHDIVLSIDNKPATTYSLNSFYTIVAGTDESLIRFHIPALEKGIHTAEFKVWNVLNNPASHNFTFEVSEELRPSIADIIASPQPASTGIQFRIYHNMPETDLAVDIRVYDLSGREHWRSTQQPVTSSPGQPILIEWNLIGTTGARLNPGAYIYRASLRSSTSKEETKAKKMLVR